MSDLKAEFDLLNPPGADTDIPSVPSVPALNPADTLISNKINAIPLEPGMTPDNEVPGLLPELRRVIGNLHPEDWRAQDIAVKKLRAEYNAAYQGQQQQLRLHNEQVKATSDATSDKYMKRFATEYVDPAVLEADDRLTTAARQNLVHYQASQLKADPPPQIDKANWSEYLNRITAPYGTPGKILDQSEIIQGASDKKYGKASMENLLTHFYSQKDASTNSVIPKKTAFRNGVKSFIEGPENYAPMDEPREVRFANFSNALDDLVEKYRKDNKDPMEVFKQTDPKDQFSSPAGALAKQFEAPYRQMFAPTGAPKAEGGRFTPEQIGRFIPSDPAKLAPGQKTWYEGNIIGAIGKEISYDEAVMLMGKLGYVPRPPTATVPTGR